MSDCCNPTCDKPATRQSLGQKGASTCGSADCKRYRKNIYPKVAAAQKAAIEAVRQSERDRVHVQGSDKDKERHLLDEVAELKHKLQEVKGVHLNRSSQAKRKFDEDLDTITTLKKLCKSNETDNQINILAAVAASELVHANSEPPPSTRREALFVRAQGRVLAYKMNVLACLQSENETERENMVLEEYLSYSNLEIIATVSRIPQIRERVLQGDIVPLSNTTIFFCSSGTKPGFAKDGKDQDIMRQSAVNVPENFAMCIPEEGMYNYVAGRVENAKVGTLASFRAHREKNSLQKSVLEETFATDDCIVLWGDARFEGAKPLPTVRVTKLLKRTAYLKQNCMSELAARNLEIPTGATVAQMRATLLNIKEFTPLVKHEKIELYTRKISASQNSICAPPGWYYEDAGKEYFHTF